MDTRYNPARCVSSIILLGELVCLFSGSLFRSSAANLERARARLRPGTKRTRKGPIIARLLLLEIQMDDAHAATGRKRRESLCCAGHLRWLLHATPATVAVENYLHKQISAGAARIRHAGARPTPTSLYLCRVAPLALLSRNYIPSALACAIVISG